MPYDGLFSFLRMSRKTFDTAFVMCVNALWRAFFISTELVFERFKHVKVSMPYDGLFSFLRHWGKARKGETEIVSMPYDGLFSFLRKLKN